MAEVLRKGTSVPLPNINKGVFFHLEIFIFGGLEMSSELLNYVFSLPTYLKCYNWPFE